MDLPVTPKGRKTRANILDAARRVVARHGFVAMCVGDVATEAGLSLGAFYRYFKNKDDMFSHLIADIHEELFNASRSADNELGSNPYSALREANYGYLEHYFANRDIMRALFEAVTVDKRYRSIWWQMRERHVERFVYALAKGHGITEVNRISTRVLAEAMASMTEQSAYCWYAQEELNDMAVPLSTAADVVARTWYQTFFGTSQAGTDPANEEKRHT
jgi:AcrR family transcriptional regulator